MSSHVDPIVLHAKRTWWPSAATCAFLASGLDILSFGLSQLEFRLIKSAGSTPSFLTYGVVFTALMFASFELISLFGVAVKATALWAIGRRQRTDGPVSARLGQWAVATYIVANLSLFVPTVLMSVEVWPTLSVHIGQFFAANIWVFRAVGVPLTLAFGCLGWASRGGDGPRQRWATGGLLALAAFGVFTVSWALFHLPTGQHWLWVLSLHAALSAATWAAVGAWLRKHGNRDANHTGRVTGIETTAAGA
jgi:hypothetical protein